MYVHASQAFSAYGLLSMALALGNVRLTCTTVTVKNGQLAEVISIMCTLLSEINAHGYSYS